MMFIEEKTDKRGINFLKLSLYAFGGLGLEVLLAFLIEPLIYGKSINEFSVIESILHWITTCIMWGVVSYGLIKQARKKYNFDIFVYKKPIGLLNLLTCFITLSFTVFVSYVNWNGFKVVKEFIYNGWLKFIFQYIYYFFETTLFVLIIVFAQKAGEIWFKKSNIPWGGILVSLTWGLVHIFTKGDLFIGILAAISGLLFGFVYLICKKNLYIAYPFIFLMFIL